MMYKDLIEELRESQQGGSEFAGRCADALERLTQPVGVEPVGVFREDDDIGHVDLIPHQQIVLKDGTKLYSAETVARLIAERDEAVKTGAWLLANSQKAAADLTKERDTLIAERDEAREELARLDSWFYGRMKKERDTQQEQVKLLRIALSWALRQMPEPVLRGDYFEGFQEASKALAATEPKGD